jgi:hypothetical protein
MSVETVLENINSKLFTNSVNKIQFQCDHIIIYILFVYEYCLNISLNL